MWVIIQGTAGALRGWVLLQTGSNLTIRIDSPAAATQELELSFKVEKRLLTTAAAAEPLEKDGCNGACRDLNCVVKYSKNVLTFIIRETVLLAFWFGIGRDGVK